MKIKRKIVARAVNRLMGMLSFDELTELYEAQQNVWQASYHLGMSAQIAAHETAQTVAREIIEGASDSTINQMGYELKLSARDLTQYAAEVE